LAGRPARTPAVPGRIASPGRRRDADRARSSPPASPGSPPPETPCSSSSLCGLQRSELSCQARDVAASCTTGAGNASIWRLSRGNSPTMAQAHLLTAARRENLAACFGTRCHCEKKVARDFPKDSEIQDLLRHHAPGRRKAAAISHHFSKCCRKTFASRLDFGQPRCKMHNLAPTQPGVAQEQAENASICRDIAPNTPTMMHDGAILRQFIAERRGTPGRGGAVRMGCVSYPYVAPT